MKTWIYARIGFAAIGGALSYLFGEMSFMLIALLVLEICDYITGVMCAIVKKELSSSVGFKGIFKKILILIFVLLGHFLDGLLHTGDVFRTAVCFFYIANESLSIIENATTLGLPVPAAVKNVLAQLKSKADKGEIANGEIKNEN